jgi:amino acid transporter
MGHAGEIPRVFGRISLRGVPLWSILLAFVFGEFAFLPFPSWQSLVGLVTSATAIMYAFAPVALAALRKNDPDRHRPYRLKGAAVLAPAGFCAANLVIYWGGFDTTWKIEAGLGVGLIVFVLTRIISGGSGSDLGLRNSAWVWPWLIGTVVIGWLGRYDSGGGNSVAAGLGERFFFPFWIDLLVIIVFNLIIFYFAVSLGQGRELVDAAVMGDKVDLENDPILEG